VEAVYFGGGTPNCLSAGQLDEILQAVHRYAPLTADCEITCEGVIQNFDAERMAAIKAGGVNRVSAGIQTFNGAIRQAHLHMLNDKSALLEAIARVRTQFTNFNLDFIYNLPGQDDTIWDDDLATAVSVGATHLTAYPLVLLERTAFYSDYVKTKKLPMPDEQREIDMFGKTLDAMSMAGYTDYYSVRDWAKPGFACRYIRLNAEGNHVLALGAGAHGYLAGITYRNTANVAAYIAQMKGRTLPLAAMREATAREQMDRFMVMGLRMRQFDMSRFTARFGAAADSVYRDKIAAMIDGGYLERKMDQLRFTPLGDIYANNVRTYFESNKTASVGYADTLGIDNSGKTHYARISRVKATDAESPL
jgi:oxygen-independent coproporphyrinogen-3 oxidase